MATTTKMKMRAVFDCSADEAGELSFNEGDILVDVVPSAEEGWYSGRLENTSDVGLFPFNYVERIYESSDTTTAAPIVVTETPEPISPSIAIPTSKWGSAGNNKSTPSRTIAVSNDNGNALPGFPALDAFEAAMSGKGTKISAAATSAPPIISPKPKLASVGGSVKPAIAEKPQLKNLNLNGDASPTRLRSYSTSSVLNKEEPISSNKTLRPSQLLHGKGTKSALELALSKGSPATNATATATTRVQSKLRSNSFSKQQNHSNPGSGGIPLVGMANLKLNSSISNDVEEEDGFQMIKPSQLRQRQQQQQSSPSPTISKSSAPTISSLSYSSNKPSVVSSWKSSQEPSMVKTNNVLGGSSSSSSSTNSPKKSTSSKLEDVPVSTSPMPRLPSRPVSNASRRSKNNRANSSNPTLSSTTTTTTTPPPVKVVESTITDKAAPPILKPKPVISQPALTRGSSNKTRSSSNPPPLQPKPVAMSSIEVLLSKNNEKKKASESMTTSPPPRVASNKPSVPPPYQPKSQLNKSNGTAAATTNSDVDSMWKTSDESTVKPSSLFNRARSTTNPTSNTDWSNAMTKRAVDNNSKAPEIKKKATPPPPPPSRPPKNNKSNHSSSNYVMDDVSKHRYEILFDTIHDDGYVDGETARFIWMKSKLSSEELSRIWRECDPDLKGLLDKHAFIEGMGRIDELLLLKQQ